MVQFKSIVKGIGIMALIFCFDIIVQVGQQLYATSKMNALVVILVNLILVAATLGFMIMISEWIHKQDASFKIGNLTWQTVYNGAINLSVLYVGSMILNIVKYLSHYQIKVPENQQMLSNMAHTSVNSLIGVAFLAIAIAPFLEELMFRGVFMTYCLSFLKNKWLRILISGFLFGAFHMMGSPLDIFGLLQYAWLGCVMAYAFEKQHHLMDSLYIHIFNNILGVVFLVI